MAGRTRKLPAHDAWSWAVTCRIGRTCGQHLTDSLTSLEVAQGKAFSDRLTFDHGGSRTGCRSSSAPFHGQGDPAFFLPNQSIRETSWWQTMCGGVERPCASWGFVKEVVTPVSRFYLYVWWPEMQLRPLRILRKTYLVWIHRENGVGQQVCTFHQWLHEWSKCLEKVEKDIST